MHHAVEVHEGIQIIKKSICKHYTACDWCESHREDFFIYTNFVLWKHFLLRGDGWGVIKSVQSEFEFLCFPKKQKLIEINERP